MERRKARLGSTKSAFRTLHRGDFFVPGTGSSERGRELFSPSRQVSPPFTRLAQPLKAAPRSGRGRLPKAPRVHACEAWPRAPHPTSSGYPSPAKLSLCPTSERLMKRPSLDRTAAIISPPRGAWISNAKKFFRLHLQRRRVGKGALRAVPTKSTAITATTLV